MLTELRLFRWCRAGALNHRLNGYEPCGFTRTVEEAAPVAISGVLSLCLADNHTKTLRVVSAARGFAKCRFLAGQH